MPETKRLGQEPKEPEGLTTDERISIARFEAMLVAMAGGGDEASVNAAYRALSVSFHPDTAGDDQAANFDALTQARDRLISKASRQASIVANALASSDPHVTGTRTVAIDVTQRDGSANKTNANAFSRASDSPPKSSWMLLAPADHTLSQVLQPTYLGAMAHEIEPGDTVEIRSLAHRFLVKLYITDVLSAQGPAAYKKASFGALSYHVITALDFAAMEPTCYDWQTATIANLPPPRGWSVLFNSVPVRIDFAGEADAREWLKDKRLRAREGKATT